MIGTLDEVATVIFDQLVEQFCFESPILKFALKRVHIYRHVHEVHIRVLSRGLLLHEAFQFEQIHHLVSESLTDERWLD